MLESAATVGLLHDIGMALLPKKLDEYNIGQLTENEQAMVRAHPDYSARVIKEKANITDENIVLAIAQHHESVDGTGYPKGLKGSQISTLARICGIAEEFDHLTSVKFGRVTQTPDQALQTMSADPRFDKGMIEEIRSMFQKPKDLVISDDKIRELMRDPISVETADEGDKLGEQKVG